MNLIAFAIMLVVPVVGLFGLHLLAVLVLPPFRNAAFRDALLQFSKRFSVIAALFMAAAWGGAAAMGIWFSSLSEAVLPIAVGFYLLAANLTSMDVAMTITFERKG